MRYITTCDITVAGDPHQAGTLLRTDDAGTILAMQRAGQITPAPEPVASPVPTPVKAQVQVLPKRESKFKKADK